MVILNTKQAAQFLGKTQHALLNSYKRWGLPYFRFGGQIKFTQESLQEWVEGRMVSEDSISGRKGK